MDKLETLRQLARVAAPTAKIRCYVLSEEDGINPLTYSYHVKLSGPEIGAAEVKSQGATAQLATEGLKRAWGKARRAYETSLVVSDCRRLSDGTLDLDQQAMLENELLHCHWTAFDALAARARKSAQAMAPSYSQAA
jgi:hypothetical protein